MSYHNILYQCTFYVLNICPFFILGANYRSQDQDYRQGSGYYSRGPQGQHHIWQGHSMSRIPMGMPNTGNTCSSPTQWTRETPNSRDRGRGHYRGRGGASWTYRWEFLDSMDRWSSDRDSYYQRQNKRTWGKNCDLLYKKLHQIDGYCGNTLSIVKMEKKILNFIYFQGTSWWWNEL